MNRFLLASATLPFLFFSLPALAAPDVSALKAAGIYAEEKDGGWTVEFHESKGLTKEVWEQIEALPNLKRLDGNGEQFDDAALARLCKIKSLESLFFNGPGFTDAGLAALAGLPALRSFGVDHSQKITGTGLSALKGAAALTSLHFGGCIVDDNGARALSELKQLKSVALGHDRITRAPLPLLAAMPNLERLELSPNWEPSAYTAQDFAALSGMQRLKELEIHDMVLPWENGLDHLKPIHSLKTLKLYWSYISDPDLAKTRAELPGVSIDLKFPAPEDKLKQFTERLQQYQALGH